MFCYGCAFCVQDRINNNNKGQSPIETLDNLLETIALESHTTNTYLAELINGEANGRTTARLTNNYNNDRINNNSINHQQQQKTDTLNRYLDNVINFNLECGAFNSLRKSDSEGSSSDHNMNNGKMSQKVTHHNTLLSLIPLIT